MKKWTWWFALMAQVACLGPLGAIEFINNGDFEAGWAPAVPPTSGALDGGVDRLPTGWTRYETFSGGMIVGSLLWQLNGNGPSAPGQSALQEVRGPENMSGDMTTVWQSLNIPVGNYSALTLSLDVMVLGHNLPAGGWVNPAFEWPVLLQVGYLDQNGAAVWWRHGWYINPPGDVPGPVNDPGMLPWHPTYNDTLVPQAVWVPQAFNLLNEMPQAKTITSIFVGGSGWSFEGNVDNVSLQGVPAQTPEAGAFCCSLMGFAFTLWLGTRKHRALN